jgi:hypothetical protein
LNFTDTAGLTLHLRARLQQRNHFDILPIPVRDRFEKNLNNNRTRVNLLEQEFTRINQQLETAGIPYLNLKGLLLCPRFVERLEERVQYDFDLLVDQASLLPAYARLQELGYTPAHSNQRQKADHLPPLIKKTGWRWRGDFFDPEIPPGIEVHYQLWEPEFERIPISLFEDLWKKRSLHEYKGLKVPSLPLNHELLYLTLHCCRHLLRSDLRLSHLYEVAYFIHYNSQNREFWKEFLAWLEDCPNSPRMVATGFALAVEVFEPSIGTSLHSWIQAHLPPGAKRWIRIWGYQDVIHGYRENKNVVFLHLSLLDRGVDQWGILRQRLLPRQLPLAVSGIYLPDGKQGTLRRGMHWLLYLGYLVRRSFFHVVNFFRLCLHLPTWLWFLRQSSKPQF